MDKVLGIVYRAISAHLIHKAGLQIKDAMPQILRSSVSYRIGVGPQQGRKPFMIRTIHPLDRPDPGLERVAKANGFSPHAGVKPIADIEVR